MKGLIIVGALVAGLAFGWWMGSRDVADDRTSAGVGRLQSQIGRHRPQILSTTGGPDFSSLVLKVRSTGGLPDSLTDYIARSSLPELQQRLTSIKMLVSDPSDQFLLEQDAALKDQP